MHTNIQANIGSTEDTESAVTVSLHSAVECRAQVADDDIDSMYRLYARHYDDTSNDKFISDLNSKTHVLFLRDTEQRIVGFSTLEIYLSDAGTRPCRVVYSGDTIIEPAHWGNSALAFEWLRFVGSVWAQQPEIPLYWLLIVKGHRTYRFLDAFGYCYVPHYKGDIAPSSELELRHSLALEKFGQHYCPNTGIAKFGQHSARLSAELARVTETHRKRPAVAFFLSQNPGYEIGEELVCLCRLSPENMKPLARRIFAPIKKSSF